VLADLVETEIRSLSGRESVQVGMEEREPSPAVLLDERETAAADVIRGGAQSLREAAYEGRLAGAETGARRT
jgi:hypothetical protein